MWTERACGVPRRQGFVHRPSGTSQGCRSGPQYSRWYRGREAQNERRRCRGARRPTTPSQCRHHQLGIEQFAKDAIVSCAFRGVRSFISVASAASTGATGESESVSTCGACVELMLLKFKCVCNTMVHQHPHHQELIYHRSYVRTRLSKSPARRSSFVP